MNAHRNSQAAIYLLDQDQYTTSSLGIFNYTCNLIRGMAEAEPPEFEVVLWVSRANYDDFVPPQCPAWMKVVCVEGRFGSGWRRLAADHGLVAWLALRHRPALIHFPKGFLPAWLPTGVQHVVTIHDTIVSYYRKHYPHFFPRLKTGYFAFLLQRAFRRAEHVITVSAFSAQCLRQELGDRPSLRVIPSAGFSHSDNPAATSKHGIFVIGSRLPHKATGETLRRLATYVQLTGFSERITLSGIQRLHDIPNYIPHGDLPIDFVGRLPFSELLNRISRSRVLVVLSEIEGFGLPLLEAYSVGTPVCFRNVASMREILDGMPGAWDGASDESFCKALDACLSMSPALLKKIQHGLALRYDWRQAIADTLQVYRDVLGGGQ